MPRDATQREEVVPAVLPPVPRLHVQLGEQRDAVPVPVGAGGVGRPEVTAHRDARVEGHEERRGARRVGGAAAVREQAAMHDVLQRELVGRIPRRHDQSSSRGRSDDRLVPLAGRPSPSLAR